METSLINKESISTLDAIWTLIQNQSKDVRKALYKRIVAAEKESLTRRQEKYVKDSLTRAFKELREAEQTGKPLKDFDAFILEMRQDNNESL